MTNTKTDIHFETVLNDVDAIIEKVDSKNKEYILMDKSIKTHILSLPRHLESGKTELYDFFLNKLSESIESFDANFIVPSNAKVGDGVMIHGFDDDIPATVVKVTKLTVTAKQDNGEKFTFRWSNDKNIYWDKKSLQGISKIN